MTFPLLKRRAAAGLACAASLSLLLSACASPPRPSIAMMPGGTLEEARMAYEICAVDAAEHGQSHVVTMYVWSVMWGGLLVGPLAMTADQENVRRRGEVAFVDGCMEDYGFERRELTIAELQALENTSRYERERILTHLTAGGALSDLP